MPLLQALSPNASLLLGTLGVGLLFYEFNRPGRVIPAASGLLLVLLVAANWMERGVRPWAVTLLGVAGMVCLLNAWRALPWLMTLAATAALALAMRYLAVPGAVQQVSLPVAIGCGVALGASSSVLTRIAYRARRAKALD